MNSLITNYFSLYKVLKNTEPICRSLVASNASSKRFLHNFKFFDVTHVINSSPCFKFEQEIFKQKYSFRCMAGHAKWQNVKHIKAEKDRMKTAACNRYHRLVSYAVKENGPDPKHNVKLANLLEQAKKYHIPMSTLETCMKKATNKKTKCGTIEILAPGGCLIILDYECDNISEMRHAIKVACKKYSANILSGEGRWRAVFEQKGILKAGVQIDGQSITSEKALDSAIEAGAEEVQQKEDEEENPYLEFLCDPADLHVVKKELEKMSFNLDEAYVGYIPSTKVQLSQEDEGLVDGLLTDLGDMHEVVRIYENVQ